MPPQKELMSSNLGSGFRSPGRNVHHALVKPAPARGGSAALKRVEVQEPARWTLAKPQAVLFDLDGTLIDTMQTFADVAADVMVRHHGSDRVRARAAYLTTSGIPFFQQLELIEPGDPRNATAAAEFEQRKVLATHDVGPTEATLVALAQLRILGIRTAVSSNNFQDQVDKFTAHCPGLLDLALGFGGGLAKGRGHFARACEVFACTREDLVFVGDSVADAELARESGVRFVGKLGTFSAPVFRDVSPEAPVIDEIGELVELFVG